MAETRVDGACLCGIAITKILNSDRPSSRKDGTRFICTDTPDTGWGMVRCDCMCFIQDTWIPTSEAVVNG